MNLKELKKYKRILILGYGLEGKAVHKFLEKYCPDSKIGIADQKDDPDYLLKQNDYDLVIKSPGIPQKLVSAKYTTPTNIFFANANGPIVGITGTKGKSTVASLTYNILKVAGFDAYLVGNIGKPATMELIKPKTKEAIYVFELSSYQLSDIEYSPHIAAVLNLFPEHMDYHGGFTEYKAAKKRILQFASVDDYFVYNPGYPELIELAKKTNAKPVPYIEKLPFSEEGLPLVGQHNIENIKAAVTIASIFKIPTKTIEKAVKNFKPLPHRLEFVGTHKGITFYDDAISTTPESTIEALNSIPNVGTIFLGGTDRGYDFSKLAEKVRFSGIRNVVLFPDSGARILEELTRLGNDWNILETRDMETAVEFGYAHTPRGFVCMLSCASPSYSVWKNFEEKGDLFKKYVKKYKK
ncbi:MAG: UDP-N-acetylmuramoyl-L-alanine--D-glutamate ligase [Candidatus Colwellbacteria bacterium]|nr:UDP-N-acetylmuramoyl-L-alanine--D-glutamate ligase [Candidatus Colwellbacteria bacterium]